MKIINQTPEEMTLTHPSLIQTILGGILTLVGGALFILSESGRPDALFISHTAFVFFGIGLFVLFTNATQVIDISKNAGTLRVKRRGFLRAKQETYPLSDIDHVELDTSQTKAFLTLTNGTRVLIDHAYRADEERTNAARVATFLGVAIQDPSKIAHPA